jgi:hypothetical protein
MGCKPSGTRLPFVFGYWLFRGYHQQAREKPFDGSSADLVETVIVPTLDSPIPAGKSAIWCGSFQLAWNRLRTEAAGQPIQVRNAETVSQRLNQAGLAESDLAPEDVYAAAGWNKSGIQQKIMADMAKKFPEAAVPGMDPDPDGVTAFAYLQAEVKYRHPYQRTPDPLPFTDGRGRVTATGSFGITTNQDSVNRSTSCGPAPAGRNAGGLHARKRPVTKNPDCRIARRRCDLGIGRNN